MASPPEAHGRGFFIALLERVRAAIRVRHYSIRTEQAYLQWVRRFIVFHGRRHPEQLGEAEVAAFLSHLAVQSEVSPATQNQALNAIVFLYKAVLGRPLAEIGGIVRAKPRECLTVGEVGRLLSHLPSRIWLVACLQHGSGLRLLESVRLRVKDLDFAHRAILVRDGKGGRDRVVTLPDELLVPLERHLAERRTLFERDTAAEIRTVQEQLGHRDVRTTQIYTHVIKRGGLAVKSPLSAVLAIAPALNAMIDD